MPEKKGGCKVMSKHCDICGGDVDYPLLVSHSPRALCANPVHGPSISMMLRLDWKAFVVLWFNRKFRSS
jgi:hypothetical protein